MAPTSITDALSRTVATLTYDADGDLLTVEDAMERTTEYAYDAYKNVNSVTAPDGTEVTATYNLLGWVTDVTDAALDRAPVASGPASPPRSTRVGAGFVAIACFALLAVPLLVAVVALHGQQSTRHGERSRFAPYSSRSYDRRHDRSPEPRRHCRPRFG